MKTFINIIKEIFGWVLTIVAAFVIAMVINIFLISTTEVIGGSMQPGLQNGDFGLTQKVTRTLNIAPDYGQIVIIDSRVDRLHTFWDSMFDCLEYNVIQNRFFHKYNQNYWIKRVIGKPGDVLEFKNNQVVRNGIPLDEPYLKDTMVYESDKKIVVPDKHVFVMGDNRNNSMDSRYIGPVPFENIIGVFILKF